MPAYLLDSTGVVRWQNEASTALWGDFHGRSYHRISIAPEFCERARTEFALKITRQRLVTDYDSALLTRAGARVPLRIHSVAIEDNDCVVAVFGVIHVEAPLPGKGTTLGQLTPRQHEVLLLLAEGCSTAQIAEVMNLSTETVRNHVRRLHRTLGVHSRLSAVAEARRRGLIG